MKNKKTLQKFTDSNIKINNILTLEQIKPSDLEQLSDEEKALFYKTLTDSFDGLTGIKQDEFYKKIELITSNSTKNQLWEKNHNLITWAISDLMQEYGRMPSKTEIAAKTELSRQTVHKHLKEYANHPQHLGQIEQFRFMTSKVLAKVFQFAVNGDIGAAKLYFNFMGCLDKNPSSNSTMIQNQNNYIQINGTVLSQETIKCLNAEQLNTIETIMKAALPEPNIINAKMINEN
jgi:predicted DNA-binding protein YlxM (UPF0122 family)